MRKRILITGATGFLGSHLCERFTREDDHVIPMDDLIKGNIHNKSTVNKGLSSTTA